MKVTIETNEEKEQEITFPCLMELKSETEILIVIIYEGFDGLVLKAENSHYKKGQYCHGFHRCKFRPLPKGTKVILEN